MKRGFSLGLKITGALLLVGLMVLFFARYSTKAYSPEAVTAYQVEEVNLEVFYNRPSKKGREIFGGLVPYGEVWRTGANEATTFYTSEDLLVDGSLLTAGKYSLWTIPGEGSWKVIFNTAMYPWGIDLDKKAYRDPAYDALILEVPVKEQEEVIEQLSIYFEPANEMILFNIAWDQTLVSIPLKTRKTV